MAFCGDDSGNWYPHVLAEKLKDQSDVSNILIEPFWLEIDKENSGVINVYQWTKFSSKYQEISVQNHEIMFRAWRKRRAAAGTTDALAAGEAASAIL